MGSFGTRRIIIVSAITLIILGLGIWIQFFLDERIPNLINVSEGMSFDYIIVGSGTAGCVVASELARNSKSTVLLIEAGEKFGRISKVPLLATYIQNTRNDWGFLSTPQKFSGRGLINKQQALPRGKGLGGSSQMNYMLHFGGTKIDFDNWKKKGATKWGYEVMKSYLKNIGPNLEISNSSSTSNCCSSKLNFLPQSSSNQTESQIWTIPKNYSLLTEAFEKAKFEFLGKRLNFQRTQYNIKNGERWNVYQMYLRPLFGFENLKILITSQVEKILFVNNYAKSVLVKNESGEIIRIDAKKEIILSAGAYGTPQILQLSGIGPKEVLDYIDVESIVESSLVGKNLFEHLYLPLYVSINESTSITFNKIMSIQEIWNYFTKGEGIYSNFGVIGSIKKITEHYGFSIFGAGAIDESSFKSLSNSKTKSFRSLFPLFYNKNQEGFVILSTCFNPLSRGTVQAITNRIENDPLIDVNLLSEPYDVQCTIKAIRTAVDIIFSKSFKKFNPKIHWPIMEGCLEYGPYREDLLTNKPSDKYLECLVRTVGYTSHHPGGTCAIGNTSESCVDNALRVRGVNGLRVVDASVFPGPVSGTPNSVVIAVAKRAVDLILNRF